MPILTTNEPPVYYPDSDGKPMAENTIQFRWITTIKGNLDVLFHERPDVFVAGDNFWYPVRGETKTCAAPDVYVVFGRPKGDRGSYQQWEEDNVPLSVVFEILSPSNTFGELLDKFEFYQLYGVQEYYVIATEPRLVLDIFVRKDGRLISQNPGKEWMSPLLGVRFVTTEATIELFHPDGKPFHTFEEIGEALESERRRNARLSARLRELGVDPESV
jgi:Uma2 family endonuclease